MKYVRRLGIALLTFALGVGVSPIRFDVEGRGCEKVVDGGGFSITSYRSSYFVNLLSVYEAYFSREEANAIFDERLSKAAKVIEVGPKFNREGAVVGRRAIALFYSKELSGPYVEIFWIKGCLLHSIRSTSTMHVREFEKHER